MAKSANKKNIDTDLLLRRSMSKKDYKGYQKKQRSQVTSGMNTGTVSFKNGKDEINSRRNNKIDIRKISY